MQRELYAVDCLDSRLSGQSIVWAVDFLDSRLSGQSIVWTVDCLDCLDCTF
jgi:hypothetical protein